MAGEKIISLALCALGLLKSIQPHWLYFDQYVYTKYPNVTSDELYQEIVPARDYAALILTLFVIAGTDYVRYKPIIILQGFFSVILCTLLIWDKQIVPLIVSQVFRGFIISTDVAFYAYIFAIVTTENYKLNVCLTQAFVLFGQFLGSLLALLLMVLGNTSNLDTISYIAFAFSLVSLIVTVLLPHVKPRIPTQREIIERELRTPTGLSGSETLRKSPWDEDRTMSVQSEVQGVIDSYAHVNDPAFTAYARSNMFSDIDTSSIGFYGDYSGSEQYDSSLRSESLGEGSITSSRGDNQDSEADPDKTKLYPQVREKFDKFVKDLKKVYSEITVIYWSLWMIVSGCCYFILQDKFSELLDEVTPGRPVALSYDAGTVTLATVIAIIPILVYGFIQRTCDIYSEPVLLVLSLVQCILVLLLSTSHNIWLIYTTYTLSYIVYQLGFVLAIFLMGDILQARRYGFVFGINLLLAIVIKLILCVLIDNHALDLLSSSQVIVTGVIMGLFGLCFLCKIMYNIIKLYRQNGQCCGNYSNPQDRDLLVNTST